MYHKAATLNSLIDEVLQRLKRGKFCRRFEPGPSSVYITYWERPIRHGGPGHTKAEALPTSAAASLEAASGPDSSSGQAKTCNTDIILDKYNYNLQQKKIGLGGIVDLGGLVFGAFATVDLCIKHSWLDKR